MILNLCSDAFVCSSGRYQQFLYWKCRYQLLRLCHRKFATRLGTLIVNGILKQEEEEQQQQQQQQQQEEGGGGGGGGGCCLSPILFNLYSKCLTKEALDGLGDFNIGEQIIQTVKYADDLALMAKEGMVLQGTIGKLIEIGRCYGMEMNVEKTKVMRISRQPSPVTIMIDQKQQENVVFF